METILVLFVCLLDRPQECKPVVGQQTALTECLAMSHAVIAGWMVANQGYEFKGIGCFEPEALKLVLGRRGA